MQTHTSALLYTITFFKISMENKIFLCKYNLMILLVTVTVKSALYSNQFETLFKKTLVKRIK